MKEKLDILLDAWGTISAGSLSAEIAQECNIADFYIDSETVVVNIEEPKSQLIQFFRSVGASTAEYKIPEQNRKRSLFLKEEREMIKKFISRFQPVANRLAAQNKTFVLKYKNREILRLGHDAHAHVLRALGIENIDIPNKLAALKFIKEFYK